MLMVSRNFLFCFELKTKTIIFLELNCPPISCGLGQFLCARDRRCINSTRRCDGIAGRWKYYSTFMTTI